MNQQPDNTAQLFNNPTTEIGCNIHSELLENKSTMENQNKDVNDILFLLKRI